MAYDIKFKLYKEGVPRISAAANYLKNLNKTRYAADLEVAPCKCDLEIPDDVEDRYAKWYDERSFEEAIERLQKEYEELSRELERKRKMRNSPAWYSFFDSEDRANVAEDIECTVEAMNDINWKIASCNKILGVIDLYQENIIVGKDSDGSDLYDEGSDVKILIYAA